MMRQLRDKRNSECYDQKSQLLTLLIKLNRHVVAHKLISSFRVAGTKLISISFFICNFNFIFIKPKTC